MWIKRLIRFGSMASVMLRARDTDEVKMLNEVDPEIGGVSGSKLFLISCFSSIASKVHTYLINLLNWNSRVETGPEPEEEESSHNLIILHYTRLSIWSEGAIFH